MRWILVGISIFTVLVLFSFTESLRESNKILEQFTSYSKNLGDVEKDLDELSKDFHMLTCKFKGTQGIYSRNIFPNNDIAVIWLHGLGGGGKRVFKKLEFYNIDNKRVSFYLPTANKIITPWRDSGLLNSWFSLSDIVNENENNEATRAAKNLIDYVKCVKQNGNFDKIIIGGTSQGGAVVWTAANIYNQVFEDGNVSFLLANTWLPVNNNKKDNKFKSEISLIHNEFDDVVTNETVTKSIEASRQLKNIVTIHNQTSLHMSNTAEHIEFIHNFIKNKF